jgi:hypothetical protein
MVLVAISWCYGTDARRPDMHCLHASAWLVYSMENTRINQALGRASISILKLTTDLRSADATPATFVEFGVRENSRANAAAKHHVNASTQHRNQISTL